MKKFSISEKEGLIYSKISGDINKIHTDNLEGYNSIFGEKICHGTLILIKIFEKINLSKLIKNRNFFSININFSKYFKYDYPISIIISKNTFNIYQEGQKKLFIIFSIRKKINFEPFETFDKKKEIIISPKKLNKNTKLNDIYMLLNSLSKYVGTVYPGQHSIISEININFNKKTKLKRNKLKIISKKKDARLPIIENQLNYKDFLVNFKSLERPFVKKNKKIDNKLLKNKIKKIKYNILIIGSSQGIGHDILNIFNENKNIKKFVTYNKNKIKINSNSIYPIQFNVYNDLNKIDKILNKNTPIKIYYFASPKIYFDNKLPVSIRNIYKYIFLKFPILLLKRYKDKDISFFYPSTTNIFENKNSYYSKIKLNAETKIKKICLKYQIPLQIIRFPAINSRQSVSLSNPNPKSLSEYLKQYPKLISKIF